eukprot:SAG31_NODE_5804_length_2322_cov_2.267656_2_plen_205_part_00
MCLSTVWYLCDVGPANGSTWVVPGSHRDLRNPRGADDAIDEHSPIPGEMQVLAGAGSVLVQDSRLWHSAGTNVTEESRASFVVRCVSMKSSKRKHPTRSQSLVLTCPCTLGTHLGGYQWSFLERNMVSAARTTRSFRDLCLRSCVRRLKLCFGIEFLAKKMGQICKRRCKQFGILTRGVHRPDALTNTLLKLGSKKLEMRRAKF